MLVFSLALTLRKPLLEFCKTVMNILPRGLDAINESRKKKKNSISWGLIFSLILFFAFKSIYKWKKGLQRSHTARLVFCVFLMCLFIFLFSCCYLMQNVTCFVLQPGHLLARWEGRSLWNLIEKICSLHFSITSRLTPRPVSRRSRGRRRGGGDGDKEAP